MIEHITPPAISRVRISAGLTIDQRHTMPDLFHVMWHGDQHSTLTRAQLQELARDLAVLAED